MTEGVPNEQLAKAFAALDAAKKPAARPSTEKRVLFLTGAIRYSEDVVLKLHEGFEVKRCNCGTTHCRGKDVCIAVTRERIIDVFTALTKHLEGAVKPVFVRPFHHRRKTEYSRNPLDAETILDHKNRYAYATSTVLENRFTEMLEELSMTEEDPFDPTNEHFDNDNDEPEDEEW